jgi:hypothetical protein
LHLDISNNNLVSKSPLVELKDANRTHKVAYLVDYGGNQCPVLEVGNAGYIVSNLGGIIAVADAISGDRALTSLNLAVNGLGVDGAEIIAAVLPGCT